MKLRALTAGLALLATGTIIGVGTQQFASADVSSGDRPVLVPIESCRLADTRPAFNVGPRTAPLGPAETYSLNTQQAGTECSGDIPATASAIAANVTAPESTGESFITLWAEGSLPNGSTLNPQAGQLVFNAATIDLAADNSFLVYNNANNVHVIIDVVGYYENHNHDDRYYTETEVEALLAAKADSTMVPIVRFSLVAGFGVDDVEFRAPVSGPPTATWDGNRWVVDVPGQSVNLNFRQALCTAVGSTPIVVSVSSIGGDLLVFTHDLAGAAVQSSAQCTLYADAP
jgi:hypothetical protein